MEEKLKQKNDDFKKDNFLNDYEKQLTKVDNLRKQNLILTEKQKKIQTK